MTKRRAQASRPPAAKRSNVSAREARTGGGGWDLSEAAGSLDRDYETLGVLGRGSFAEINLVRRRETGELAALKFCCKLDVPSFSHLRTEATLAARVRHPFVLSPLAIADSPGRAGNYSVLLPLCPGGDLLQLLKRQPSKALAEPSVRAYAAMVVLGLRALHAAGLAYRDLKPENLLVRANGYLCLGDFGLAATAAECKKKGNFVGTAMYQAPELLRKLPHSVAVDWWALGCLLLEMVTGASPFLRDDDDETAAAVLSHTGGAPPPPPPPPPPPDGATDVAAGGAAARGAFEPSAAMVELCGALLTPAPAERLGGQGGGTKQAKAATMAAAAAAAEGTGASGGGELTAVVAGCASGTPLAETAAAGGTASSSAGGGGDTTTSLEGHRWFEGLDWEACAAMALPPPSVPPPLDVADTDAALIELAKRCQQGFDF